MHPVVIFFLSPINNGGAETERLQTLPQLRVVRRVSMGGRITLWVGTTRLMAGVAISHTEGRSWLPLPRRCRHRPLDCEAFRNRLSWLGPGCGPVLAAHTHLIRCGCLALRQRLRQRSALHRLPPRRRRHLPLGRCHHSLALA